MKKIIIAIIIATSCMYADVIVELNKANSHIYNGIYNSRGQELAPAKFRLYEANSKQYIEVITTATGMLFIEMIENGKVKYYKGVSK